MNKEGEIGREREGESGKREGEREIEGRETERDQI